MRSLTELVWTQIGVERKVRDIGPPPERQAHQWKVDSGQLTTQPIAEHLDALGARLQLHAESIRHFLGAADATGVLQIVVREMEPGSEDTELGFHISEDIISLAATLGTPIDCDERYFEVE